LTSLKRSIAGLLCFLLTTLPVLSAPQAGGQHAGEIDALIPAAMRNGQTATVKEDLQWNDLLKTERSGRVRAGLTDGSILSVGSNSELRVVQHDGASQQTSLELNVGKVRSRVTKITQPGGKFEMKTPNAVIGVIGTDFYAEYESNKTTVICYEGRVSVTPLGAVQVAQNGQTSTTNNAISVAAGQMVVITTVIPPGGFQITDTPPALQQTTLLATDVPETNGPPTKIGRGGHGLRNAFIASGIVVGVGLGVALGTRVGNTAGCKVNPTTGQCP
jgi:FecR protein